MNERIRGIIFELSWLDHVNNYARYRGHAAEEILKELGYGDVHLFPEFSWDIICTMEMHIPSGLQYEEIDDDVCNIIIRNLEAAYKKEIMRHV